MTATRAAKRPTNLELPRECYRGTQDGEGRWHPSGLSYARALDLLDGWPDVAVPVSMAGGRKRYVHLRTMPGTWDIDVTLFGHRIVTITPTGYYEPTHAGYPTMTTADALTMVTPLRFRRWGITGRPSNPGETLVVWGHPRWSGCDVESIAFVTPGGEVTER